MRSSTGTSLPSVAASASTCAADVRHRARRPDARRAVPNPEATRRRRPDHTWRGSAGRCDWGRGRLRTPGRVQTVELLAAERMLPAIDFVFSRARRDQAVEQCLGAGLSPTNPGERAEIRAIVERSTAAARTPTRISTSSMMVLARRHRGRLRGPPRAHVPPMKEAVEEAFRNWARQGRLPRPRPSASG